MLQQREGRAMVHHLVCHPDTPARGIGSVDVELALSSDQVISLAYRVRSASTILLPDRGEGRADGLWRGTCCELFLRDADGAGYRELNFATSGAWAAYAFDGYRRGMADLEIEPPVISTAVRDDRITVAVIVAAGSFGRIGLSAVLEERDGALSYWALAHPPGRPDFHHPACFALELPAPGAS